MYGIYLFYPCIYSCMYEPTIDEVLLLLKTKVSHIASKWKNLPFHGQKCKNFKKSLEIRCRILEEMAPHSVVIGQNLRTSELPSELFFGIDRTIG